MRSVLVLLACVVAVAACGDDGPTGSWTVPGVYDLETINGAPLPYVVPQADGSTVEITSGRLTISTDGTFTDRVDYIRTHGTQVTPSTDTRTGDYLFSNRVLTLMYDSGGSADLTFANESLTRNDQGRIFVYRR